jgi:DNA-binding GntR family transcriptional regulator
MPAAPENLAEALRDAILRGALRPGQPLPQDELAAQHGVSKIPMREALVRLQAEGLVQMSPNRGAFVATLSPADVSEIYDMRIALESLALERAVPGLTKSELVRAEGLITIMDDQHDPLQWSRLNWEFHRTLYEPARMPRLMDAVSALHANVARYHVVFLSGVAYHTKAQRQHRVILRACKAGQGAKAAAQLATHMREAATQIAEFLSAK